MQWNDKQYERVARYLDGDPVELTSRERELAEEVRSGEVIVTAGIDRRVRHRAMDQARRRMSAELARPTRRKALLACVTAAEAIAVAAVLVIALTLQGVVTPPAAPVSSLAGLPAEALGLAERSEIANRISLVRQDLDMLEAELMVPAAIMDPTSFEIDELRYDLEELLNYEPPEFYLEG